MMHFRREPASHTVLNSAIMFARALIFLLAAALLGGPAQIASRSVSAAGDVPRTNEQIRLSFAPLVKSAAPAVVNIYAKKITRTRGISPLFDDPFFRRFFGDAPGFGAPRERVQNSLGSGVIVGADGIIVTNHHVIEGADQITVVLADRREFEAKLLGADERSDLAVLKIKTNGKPLPFLVLSGDEILEVGDLVLAIGNPFGVGQTVTSGIVSALARSRTGISDLNSFIQTDAAINPGNSGGALIDMDGRLIGINTAIFSKSGGSLGIGFAIPSIMVRSVLVGLTEGGRIIRPWLGAWGQGITADIAASLSMERPRGVLITEIYPDGAAGRAGLKTGDVVLSINGKEINVPQDLRFRIATLKIGDKAILNVRRRNETHNLNVELEAPPEQPKRNVTELDGVHPLSGAVVANMSPALADELNLESFESGVIVIRVRRRSPAGRVNLRPGDTILSVQGRDIGRVRDLKPALGSKESQWRIVIRRNGRALRLVVNR